MNTEHRADNAKRRHFTVSQYSAISLHLRPCYAGWLKKSVGWHEQLHSHSFLEVLLVTGGSGFVTANQSSCLVTKGDAVIYNPGVAHFESSSQQDPMSVLFFAAKKFCLPGLPPNSLPLKGNGVVLKTAVEFKSLRGLLQQAVTELEQKSPLYAPVVNSLIAAALLKLWRLALPENARPEPNPVLEAAAYMDAHFAEPLSLNLLAQRCSVSKYHLAHLFSAQKGMTIGAYLLQCRLLAAQNLLEAQSCPVHEVARLTGFQNSGYFCKVFKQHCGVSPLQYRKEHTARSQPVLLPHRA